MTIFFVSKAKELSVRSGVGTAVLIQDENRLDLFCSNERLKERLTPQLQTILNTEVQTKKAQASANCNLVKGKKLAKFPPNTKVTIEYDNGATASVSNNATETHDRSLHETGSDSDKEN